MASRKIIGTTNIRRKLSKKAKAAIAAVAVIAVGIGGFLFINNTDAGAEIKNKVAGMSVVTEEGGFGGLFGAGNTPAPETQSIIRIDTEVVTVNDRDQTINRTGGYVSGGGTLREGEILTLNLMPFKGYRPMTIAIKGQSTHIRLKAGTRSFSIGYNNESADIKVNQNTTIVVCFAKEESSVIQYTLNTVPEIGKYTQVDILQTYKKEMYPKKSEVHINVDANDIPILLYPKWSLTYSELDQYFSCTQETYTYGGNKTETNDNKVSTGTNTNKTIVVSKTYDVVYDLYAFDDDGEVVYKFLNYWHPVTVELYDLSDPQNPVQKDDLESEYQIPYNGSVYDVHKDFAQYALSRNCTFTLVLHTKGGSTYQAITRAEPSYAGTTSGDRTSNEAFTATISATPAKGYRFDRWTWRGEEDIYDEELRIFKKEMDVRDQTVSVTPTGITVYTAHFIPEIYNVELESATPDDGGTVVGLGDYEAHSDVNITLKPSPGYRVESWSYSTPDGNRYSGDSEEFTIKDITSDIKLNVKFTNGKARIDVKASPVDGGSVTVDNTTSSKGKKPDYEEFVPGQESARLEATPRDGYVFLYWKDSTGKKYDGITDDTTGVNTLDLPSVASSETFTACFAPKNIKLYTKVYPNEGGVVPGSVSITGDNVVKQDNYYEANSYTPVTIKAIEASGYHFQKFVDSDGNEYTSNPLIKEDLIKDTTITAIFIPDEFTITAQATPVTGGTAKVAVLDTTKDPATVISEREGSNTVSYNDRIRITATADERFIFRYFEDQHGTKYGGTVAADGKSASFEFNAVNGDETYKAVFGLAELNLSVTVDPKDKASDNDNYKAGGFKVDYTASDNSIVSTPAIFTDWTTDGTTNKKAKGQTTVKITAIPGDGYHFSKFVDTDGNVYTENPLVYPALVENKDVEIIFVPDRFTINAKSVPVTGGTVDVAILDATGTVTSRREGSNEVSYNEKVRIIAKPNGNFAFRYFEDPNGAKYGATDYDADGNPYFEFNAVNGAETYKAVFAMSNVSLTMKVDPATLADGKYEAGKFKVNYTYVDADGHDVNTDLEGDEPGFKITNIKGQTSVKITAIELGGYKFSKFIDSEGNIWNDNPMVLGDLIENKEIEVIFVKEHWKIEGVSSPEAGGKVTLNGVESGVDVDYGDPVTIEAKANSGYRFKYFKDELGNEFIANPIRFDAINGSEKYTAYFAKNDVSITLDLAPEGAGTVRFNSEPAVSKRTTYQTGGKSSVTLTATPKEDVSFLYWRDQDGKMYNDNPLALSDISADLIFTAVFDTKYDTVRALASPASGGKIRKIVNDDGSITLIAIANRGYLFTNWKKDNTLLTMGTTYKIPADKVKNGDVYTAYFKKDSNYDLKSDITKEKFYREWRKVITPNYTVTRDSMKLLAMQTVAGLRQYDDATPPLRTYGAVANAQAYFDEKTARDAARLDGVFGDAELMSAEGDVLRPDELPDADKYQKDAEDFTDRKFGDLYETEILTVKRVLEPDDFDNIKRTYLWRYTGAEYKDNIYLLYNIGGKKPDWTTPIVDEDGVLKFTIDELDNYDVVAVVRVKIKEQ